MIHNDDINIKFQTENDHKDVGRKPNHHQEKSTRNQDVQLQLVAGGGLRGDGLHPGGAAVHTADHQEGSSR